MLDSRGDRVGRGDAAAGAPVAAGDTYTLAHDTTLTVSDAGKGVLANDTDPGGLSADRDAGADHDARRADAECRTARSATRRTPAIIGSDSFTYQATDGTTRAPMPVSR